MTKNSRMDKDALIDAMLDDMDEEAIEEAAREALINRVSKMKGKEREDLMQKLVVEPEERMDVIHTALVRLAESLTKKDDYLPEGWDKAKVLKLAEAIDNGDLDLVSAED